MPDGTVIELVGTAQRDELNGGDGLDILRGDAGDDALYAGAGDDSSFGGNGDDVIIDVLGNVLADGGAGDDVISIWEDSHLAIGGDGTDTLDLEAAALELGLSGALIDLEENAADFLFEIDAASEQVSITAEGDAVLSAADVRSFEAFQLPGDADILFTGSSGDDALSVDLSTVGGVGQLLYTASGGDDSVISRAVEASGGAQDVFDLSGLTSAATFASIDMPLVVHAGGSLTLAGVIGDFIGTDNGDTINTQPLAFFDGLIAAGTDSLTVSYALGSGADTLVLNEGAIDFAFTGFDVDNDAIDLSGVERLAGEAFSNATINMALSAIDVDGTPSTQLTYDDTGTSAASIVLEGVTPGELSADNFLFAAAEV